jgi:hypothetical protein
MSETISLGKISKDESEFISRMHLYTRGSDDRFAASLKFAIEYKMEIQDYRHSPGQIELQWKVAEEILLALRLFKEGDIGLSFAYIFQGPLITTYEKYPLKIPWVDEYIFELGYTLGEHEKRNFLQLWKKLQTALATRPHLTDTTQLFTKALGETSSLDRLVQCTAAFESLVLSAEEKINRNKGLLISARIAELLGAGDKEKTTIKKDLKAAYHLRNIVVHGNITELEKYTNEAKVEISCNAEKYLRNVLKTCINQNRS